jgi:hypothetical protein
MLVSTFQCPGQLRTKNQVQSPGAEAEDTPQLGGKGLGRRQSRCKGPEATRASCQGTAVKGTERPGEQSSQGSGFHPGPCWKEVTRGLSQGLRLVLTALEGHTGCWPEPREVTLGDKGAALAIFRRSRTATAHGAAVESRGLQGPIANAVWVALKDLWHLWDPGDKKHWEGRGQKGPGLSACVQQDLRPWWQAGGHSDPSLDWMLRGFCF